MPVRYDLDGDGEVVFETGGSVTINIEDLDEISSYASQVWWRSLL